MTTTHKNPIIPVALESFDGSDRFGWSSEWLFQMCRLWAEYQDSHIGTVPVDYRDPSGPCDRATSEETGEDTAYWEAVDALDLLGEHQRQGAVVEAFHYFDGVYKSAKAAGEDY